MMPRKNEFATVEKNWQRELPLKTECNSDSRKKSKNGAMHHNRNSTYPKPALIAKFKHLTEVSSDDAQKNKKVRADSPQFREILDDIQLRFIMNLPQQELSSADRLFFQLEQAWWFYEDHIADEDPSMPRFTLKCFAKLLFHHCPLLSQLTSQYNELFESFKSWKGQIPVAGCILLNDSKNKMILVQNWNKKGRSLPRGKVNEAEQPLDAAIREVLEETGFDVTNLINPKDCINTYVHGQQSTMFIVKNVPESYEFAPRVRKEISSVDWFYLHSLPPNTYGVEHIMKRLNRWLQREEQRISVKSNLRKSETGSCNNLSGEKEKIRYTHSSVSDRNDSSTRESSGNEDEISSDRESQEKNICALEDKRKETSPKKSFMTDDGNIPTTSNIVIDHDKSKLMKKLLNLSDGVESFPSKTNKQRCQNKSKNSKNVHKGDCVTNKNISEQQNKNAQRDESSVVCSRDSNVTARVAAGQPSAGSLNLQKKQKKSVVRYSSTERRACNVNRKNGMKNRLSKNCCLETMSEACDKTSTFGKFSFDVEDIMRAMVGN